MRRERYLRYLALPSLLLGTVFLTLSCSAQDDYVIAPAFPDIFMSQPTDIQNAGDGTDRLFVCSKGGVIHVFPNDPNVTSTETFLDLSSIVITPSEMGLLGLAFHPDYANNGYFYVNYNAREGTNDFTRISRFSVSAEDPNRADPSSELILLEFIQPFKNHDGGQIAFGPDGYLYIATGDGGSGNDPLNAGQDLRTLLGKILRIDVDNTDEGMDYAVPETNPYAGNSQYLPEIYAWGLRNPWRFSFDSETGTLWCGDVGQNLYEEISIIEKGGNYGWRLMEGFHCFNPRNPQDRNFDCDSVSLIAPVWEYEHTGGNVSITGGYVYHGSRTPGLQGKYVYADFSSGRIWALTHTPNVTSNELIRDTPLNVSTFGVDEAEELYIGGFDGKIYEIRNISGVEDENDPLGSASLQPLAPNPNRSATTSLRYNVASPGSVAITIVNGIGEEMMRLVDEVHEPGEYALQVDTSRLPEGSYFVRLASDFRQETRKLQLVR